MQGMRKSAEVLAGAPPLAQQQKQEKESKKKINLISS